MTDIGQNLSNFASRLEAIAEKQRSVYDKGYSDAIGIGPPSGEIELPENGTFDVTTYATAKVNVTPVINLQEKTATQNGDVLPDDGYDGLSKVKVNVAANDDNYLAQFAEGTITELDPTNLAGCTAIGASAFLNNQTLVSVEIPSSVTSIGEKAFSGTYLTSVTFEEGANPTLNARAFYSNSKLLTVAFPNSYAKGTGLETFKNCSKLENVVLSENTTYVSESSFASCSKLANFHIPSKVTGIGKSAFYSCQALASITFGENSACTTFSEGAFSNCYALESFEIPPSVTNFGTSTFYRCSALKGIKIPVGNTGPWENTFYGCTSLEYIDLTEYGTDDAFPYLLNKNAFTNCGTSTASGTFEIRVKSGRKAELAAMANWSYYANNIVEYEPPEIIDFYIDGTLYSAEEGMTWQRWVNSEYSSESFTITDNFVRPVSDPYWNVVDSINENPVLSTDVIFGGAEYKTMSYD